ncbi:hypothetical protein BAC3_02254 [uncultured bacterium]|nr:hypothetical protein BAC3_02254 [uncultured bacterium]
MNKIEHLIQQLCPEGVEYKSLGKVCDIRRGSSITKSAVTEGSIPVIAGGRTPAYFHNISNRIGETIVIAGSGAYAGFVSWWEQPIFVSDAFSIKSYDDLLTKFCFYWLKNMQQRLYDLKSGGGVPHVYPRDIEVLFIPIPPLEIQKEIVNILDTFTQLEAELEAELEARKKQYEYYRNSLLNFDGKEVEWKTIGDVGSVKMCKRIMKHETSNVGDIPFFKIGTFGKTPDAFISSQLFEEYKKKYNYPLKGEVLISAAGTIGRTVIYNGEPAYFQDSNIVWLSNNETKVTNKFLYYYYKIIKWETEGGTIPRLYNDNILRTKIPIPPLSEQERIVAILDKFDALVNDISVGLPAEIAARKKQYEYYREKLLTFKEKPNA